MLAVTEIGMACAASSACQRHGVWARAVRKCSATWAASCRSVLVNTMANSSPPITSHEIFQANAGLEPVADLAQDGISRLVTQRIIDVLEMVEVDEEDGARPLRPPAAGEFFLDAAHHIPVVG